MKTGSALTSVNILFAAAMGMCGAFGMRMEWMGMRNLRGADRVNC